MKSPKMRIVAPDRRRHVDGLADLMAKTFGNYFSGIEGAPARLRREGFYDWQATRIGLVGDRIVSHFGVRGYDMRVGAARVRTAGIGGVSTHGSFRKQGVMWKTGTATVEAIRECGYDMSVLFGIPDFYHRFGYVDAWPESSHWIQVNNLPAERLPAKLKLKSFRGPRAGFPDIRRLHNGEYSRLTGTAVRPTWTHGDVAGQRWVDGRGKTCGYVIAHAEGPRLVCDEAAGDADQALRVLRTLAKKWGCHDIEFRMMPYLHALAVRLRRGRCRVESHYDHSGGAMVRVVNLASTLDRLCGELARRLKGSAFDGWSGTLAIQGDGEAAAIRIGKGRVSVAKPGAKPTRTKHVVRAGPHVAQLVMGTDDPLEVAERGRMRLAGDARELVRVLFPRQYPMLCARDRY